MLAALGAAIAALVKALRGPSAPAFANHPSMGDGTGRPLLVAVPPAEVEVAPSAVIEPAPAAVIEPAPPTAVEPAPATQVERASAAALEVVPPDEEAPSWREPIDGACPDGYLIKAKVASGIFHVPGGLAYDRTKPDRCYPSPEAAMADGFRAAKR